MGVAFLPDVPALRSVQFTQRELVRTGNKKKKWYWLSSGRSCEHHRYSNVSVSTPLPPDVRELISPRLAYKLARFGFFFFLVPDDFLHLSLDLEWEVLVPRKCYMGGPGASATWCGVSPAGTLNVRISPGCWGFSTTAAFWKVKKKKETHQQDLVCC